MKKLTRLEVACRTAVTFAPTWGSGWALEHVLIALRGEDDPLLWERGRRMNRVATLGSRVVELRERIRCVRSRLGDVAVLEAELASVEKEWERIRIY